MLQTLYNVREEKSNVFLSKTHNDFIWLFVQTYILTIWWVYGLITANMEKTLKENLSFSEDSREPTVGASRYQGIGQSGSRVGLVNTLRQ